MSSVKILKSCMIIVARNRGSDMKVLFALLVSVLLCGCGELRPLDELWVNRAEGPVLYVGCSEDGDILLLNVSTMQVRVIGGNEDIGKIIYYSAKPGDAIKLQRKNQ
jgi:hypothetical protein